MPQLAQAGQIYASQLFWLAIVFALIYFGIGRAMVPKIERTVEDRTARIEGDLAAAAAARDQAASANERYESGLETARSQATRAVADAQARATAIVEGKLKDSDARVEAELHAATQRIEASKNDALAGIEAATVEAVEAIVAKLSGAPVDRGLAEASVRRELAHG